MRLTWDLVFPGVYEAKGPDGSLWRTMNGGTYEVTNLHKAFPERALAVHEDFRKAMSDRGEPIPRESETLPDRHS